MLDLHVTHPLLKVLAPLHKLFHTARARLLHSPRRKATAPRTAALRAWGIHTSQHGKPHMAAPLCQLPVEPKGKTDSEQLIQAPAPKSPSGERACLHSQHRSPARQSCRYKTWTLKSTSRARLESQGQEPDCQPENQGQSQTAPPVWGPSLQHRHPTAACRAPIPICCRKHVLRNVDN